MKAIRNIEGKKLLVSYKGNDFEFPKGKAVLVDKKLFEHIRNLIPLAFDFDYKAKKGEELSEPKQKKTNPVFQKNVTTLRKNEGLSLKPDQTPESGTTDRDGVSWYGPGLQKDSI